MLKTEYQYISFSLVQNVAKRKTTIWRCLNKKSSANLGTIGWFIGWRQYCFQPNDFTVFSSGCLADIQDFIRQLMEERNKGVF